MKHYYVIDKSRNWVCIDNATSSQDLYCKIRTLLHRMQSNQVLKQIEDSWVDYGDGEVSFTIMVRNGNTGLFDVPVDYYISLKWIYLEILLLAERHASESVPTLSEVVRADRFLHLKWTQNVLKDAIASDDFVIDWAGDPSAETYSLFLRSTKTLERYYSHASPLMIMKSVLFTFHDVWVMSKLSATSDDRFAKIADRVSVLNIMSDCYMSIWAATGWRQEKCSRELDLSSVIARHLYKIERTATRIYEKYLAESTLPSSSFWQVQLKISLVRRVIMLLWLYPLSCDNLALVKNISEAL